MEDIPRDIIERAVKGEMAAFEQIYRATSGFVYRSALRILNNSADAEDVTQDIFMKIYDNLKNFQFRANFKTWVYRITVNTAINIYRRNLRQISRRGDYDTAIETAGHSPEIIQAAKITDSEKIISSLLETLTAEHRAVIVLREIEGLSYEDIAQSLKINLNTVRSRLKRAREALLERSKKAVQNEL